MGSSSSSLTPGAMAGIDKINKGERELNFYSEYEIICLFVCEEEITIIIRGINDNDAAAIAGVLKTNTTLILLQYVWIFTLFN
jgi:hypothetical protein